MVGYTSPCLYFATGRRSVGRARVSMRLFASRRPWGEIRARGDLRKSRTNQACSVIAPVKLIRWDHVATICEYFAQFGIDCAFLKAGRKSTYKSLQASESEALVGDVTLTNPSGGRRYTLASRTLLCGSIPSGAHYNIRSLGITELYAIWRGIPYGALLL